MQLLRVAWALTGAAICCFLILLIHSRLLKEGQLAAGTCEIVTLDRDSSQPRRTIARQTARCACKKGQIAGTTRARPACVDGLVTQPETGKPGSDCLRESSLPVTLDKLAIKHFLFPVTGHRGFLTAPSCYLLLGQHVVSTSSPLLSACSVNLAAHAHATEVGTP
ncbi:chemokine-like protein TAFA-5a isoform X1 [Oreochromis aureus]|uniref:TAFA chemokine like family member 5 n=1 Tax=Oreochromis aureus TaxID=47969 RepID=A0AAZ1WW16_OREAU|nr:chemokine-like protein TAFA-5a isoform X1 [Oreochromis aureus]